MKSLFGVLLLVCFAFQASFAQDAEEILQSEDFSQEENLIPGELNIISKYKPENCWPKAQKGDSIFVHYTGRLEDGRVFDSSEGRDPFNFKLGSKQVIPGWEQGIEDMCPGEKRKLVVPSKLAYGDQGVPQGGIPGGATLVFDVELLHIAPRPSVINSGIAVLRTLWPGIVVLVIGWYLYTTAQERAEAARKEKLEKKQEKKRR
eukprot:TRINITY_DN5370_c0_g2_i1.p1 TRINITY_DN5370_c0_g2~~TRINITY_DN5370_c0_g2_i1.p1  ORF type:complete len:204 (+),score=85.07 TRINITY_DN5370_c0_g2_i1:881-1492(+)